ncbi:MAG TPA: SLC13 family permease [Gaiellaceae bacterium]|nr:SLC13 family permease [Gaiellaceae bacterium]
MIIRVILAAVAVGVTAIWPRARLSAAAVLGVGAVSALVAGGGVAGDAVRATAPMLVFLTAALGVAALAERAGLSAWAAGKLAALGRGRTRRLYALVCLASGLLTCLVSLDGAVVLMVPVVRALARRCRVSFAPFFLGAVAVANAASLAVPLGNPTNLVVMSTLGLSPGSFLHHLFVPGLCAAVVCALVPARRLGRRHYVVRPAVSEEPVPMLLVPWRIGAQLTGLVAALDGLVPSLALRSGGLAALLAVAAGAAAASALANNLPVSASVAALATPGPGAYAALVGLTVGALATPHGSVATLIARDLAGQQAGRRWARLWVPATAVAVTLATLLLWASF